MSAVPRHLEHWEPSEEGETMPSHASDETTSFLDLIRDCETVVRHEQSLMWLAGNDIHVARLLRSLWREFRTMLIDDRASVRASLEYVAERFDLGDPVENQFHHFDADYFNMTLAFLLALFISRHREGWILQAEMRHASKKRQEEDDNAERIPKHIRSS